jgi:hypothetical protein
LLKKLGGVILTLDDAQKEYCQEVLSYLPRGFGDGSQTSNGQDAKIAVTQAYGNQIDNLIPSLKRLSLPFYFSRLTWCKHIEEICYHMTSHKIPGHEVTFNSFEEAFAEWCKKDIRTFKLSDIYLEIISRILSGEAPTQIQEKAAQDAWANYFQAIKSTN